MAKQTEDDHVHDYVHDQEDLPGYPPYPPEDDIMRKGQRIDGDFGEDTVATPSAPQQADNRENVPLPDGEVPPGKYDVTEEDLQGLGPVDLSLDLGDDEQLKQRSQPVDFAGSDLDVPGSELDDASEAMGAEDEENNPYSLGGDSHHDLEEGKE